MAKKQITNKIKAPKWFVETQKKSLIFDEFFKEIEKEVWKLTPKDAVHYPDEIIKLQQVIPAINGLATFVSNMAWKKLRRELRGTSFETANLIYDSKDQSIQKTGENTAA